jgi:hypothetical protein
VADETTAADVAVALDAVAERIPELKRLLGAGGLEPAGVVRIVHAMLPPLLPTSSGDSAPRAANEINS